MPDATPKILAIRDLHGNVYDIPAIRGFSYALNENIFELVGETSVLNIKEHGIAKNRLAASLQKTSGYYIKPTSGSLPIKNMSFTDVYYTEGSFNLLYDIGSSTHTLSIPLGTFLICVHPSVDLYYVYCFKTGAKCVTYYKYVRNTSFTTYSLDADIRTINNNINSLNTSVNEIEGLISTLTETVTGINTRVGTAEGNITSLGTRVGTAEGNITSLGTRVGTAEGSISSIGTDLSNFHTDYNADMTEISSVLDTLDQGKVSIRQADANIGKTIGVNRFGNAVPEGRIVNMDLPTYVLNRDNDTFSSYPDFEDLQSYHDVYKQYLVARVVYYDGSVDYLPLSYATDDTFVFNTIYAAKDIEYIEHINNEVPTYERASGIIVEELCDTTSTSNVAKQQVMSRYGTSKAIKVVENLIKKPGVENSKQISAVNIYGNQEFINDDKVKGVEFVSTIPAVDDHTVTLNTLYIAPLVCSPYYHMLKASSSDYSSKPYMVCYTQGAYQCVSISAQPFYCDAGAPAGLKNDSVTCLTYKTVFTEYGIDWSNVQITAGALNFNNNIYIVYANHEVTNTSSIYTVIDADLAYGNYGNNIASNYITRVWYNVPSGTSGIVNLSCDTKIIESNSFYKLIYPIVQTNAVLKSHTTAANAGKIYQVNQYGNILLTTDTLDTIIDNRVNAILNTAITNLNEVIGV